MVKELLEEGAYVDATDEMGLTPLHEAAKNGQLDIVGMLLNAGADPTAVDNNNKNPLHYAAENGHTDILRLLLGFSVTPSTASRVAESYPPESSGDKSTPLGMDSLDSLGINSLHRLLFPRKERSISSSDVESSSEYGESGDDMEEFSEQMSRSSYAARDPRFDIQDAASLYREAEQFWSMLCDRNHKCKPNGAPCQTQTSETPTNSDVSAFEGVAVAQSAPLPAHATIASHSSTPDSESAHPRESDAQASTASESHATRSRSGSVSHERATEDNNGTSHIPCSNCLPDLEREWKEYITAKKYNSMYIPSLNFKSSKLRNISRANQKFQDMSEQELFESRFAKAHNDLIERRFLVEEALLRRGIPARVLQQERSRAQSVIRELVRGDFATLLLTIGVSERESVLRALQSGDRQALLKVIHEIAVGATGELLVEYPDSENATDGAPASEATAPNPDAEALPHSNTDSAASGLARAVESETSASAASPQSPPQDQTRIRAKSLTVPSTSPSAEITTFTPQTGVTESIASAKSARSPDAVTSSITNSTPLLSEMRDSDVMLYHKHILSDRSAVSDTASRPGSSSSSIRKKGCSKSEGKLSVEANSPQPETDAASHSAASNCEEADTQEYVEDMIENHDMNNFDRDMNMCVLCGVIEGDLIYCDSCSLGYHTSCLRFDEPPEKPWYCCNPNNILPEDISELSAEARMILWKQEEVFRRQEIRAALAQRSLNHIHAGKLAELAHLFSIFGPSMSGNMPASLSNDPQHTGNAHFSGEEFASDSEDLEGMGAHEGTQDDVDGEDGKGRPVSQGSDDLGPNSYLPSMQESFKSFLLHSKDGTGRSPLAYAAAKGQISSFRILLAAGADISCRSSDGKTVLHHAAWGGHLAMVSLLLSYGLSPNEKDDRGATPLYCAAEKGHSEVARCLLEAGADPDAANDDDNEVTPLRRAAACGHIGVIIVLREFKANMNLASKTGNNALHDAAWNGRTEAIKVLVAAGADVSAKDNHKWTALHYAADHGHTDCINALWALGADVSAKTGDRWTPLRLAAKGGHVKAVAALLNANAKFLVDDEEENYNQSPLHAAARLRDSVEREATVRTLIEAGADLSARDKEGWTPVHCAAANGHADTLRALISAGAVVDCVDNHGLSPLREAAAAGHTNAVVTLLSVGANPDAKCKQGYTPLHDSAWQGRVESVRALLEVGADPRVKAVDGRTPLHCSAQRNHYAVVELLLKHLTVQDLMVADKDGWTPLHKAAQEGNEKVVRMLAEFGGPEVVNAGHMFSSTPLHEAAIRGSTACVRILLSHGANVSAIDSREFTPLHCAVDTRGDVHCKTKPAGLMLLLLAAGANPNARTSQGITPLHLASRSGNYNVVELLLRWGADPNIRDKDRQTAADVSVGANIKKLLRLFRAPAPPSELLTVAPANLPKDGLVPPPSTISHRPFTDLLASADIRVVIARQADAIQELLAADHTISTKAGKGSAKSAMSPLVSFSLSEILDATADFASGKEDSRVSACHGYLYTQVRLRGRNCVVKQLQLQSHLLSPRSETVAATGTTQSSQRGKRPGKGSVAGPAPSQNFMQGTSLLALCYSEAAELRNVRELLMKHNLSELPSPLFADKSDVANRIDKDNEKCAKCSSLCEGACAKSGEEATENDDTKALEDLYESTPEELRNLRQLIGYCIVPKHALISSASSVASGQAASIGQFEVAGKLFNNLLQKGCTNVEQLRDGVLVALVYATPLSPAVIDNWENMETEAIQKQENKIVESALADAARAEAELLALDLELDGMTSKSSKKKEKSNRREKERQKQLEKERLEREEQERLEKELLEKEKLEKERLEKEKEKQEKEKAAKKVESTKSTSGKDGDQQCQISPITKHEVAKVGTDRKQQDKKRYLLEGPLQLAGASEVSVIPDGPLTVTSRVNAAATFAAASAQVPPTAPVEPTQPPASSATQPSSFDPARTSKSATETSSMSTSAVTRVPVRVPAPSTNRRATSTAPVANRLEPVTADASSLARGPRSSTVTKGKPLVGQISTTASVVPSTSSSAVPSTTASPVQTSASAPTISLTTSELIRIEPTAVRDKRGKAKERIDKKEEEKKDKLKSKASTTVSISQTKIVPVRILSEKPDPTKVSDKEVRQQTTKQFPAKDATDSQISSVRDTSKSKALEKPEGKREVVSPVLVTKTEDILLAETDISSATNTNQMQFSLNYPVHNSLASISSLTSPDSAMTSISELSGGMNNMPNPFGSPSISTESLPPDANSASTNSSMGVTKKHENAGTMGPAPNLFGPAMGIPFDQFLANSFGANNLFPFSPLNQLGPMGQMNNVNQMGQMNPLSPMGQMGQLNALNPLNALNSLNSMNRMSQVGQFNAINQLGQLNSNNHPNVKPIPGMGVGNISNLATASSGAQNNNNNVNHLQRMQSNPLGKPGMESNFLSSFPHPAQSGISVTPSGSGNTAFGQNSGSTFTQSLSNTNMPPFAPVSNLAGHAPHVRAPKQLNATGNFIDSGRSLRAMEAPSGMAIPNISTIQPPPGMDLFGTTSVTTNRTFSRAPFNMGNTASTSMANQFAQLSLHGSDPLPMKSLNPSVNRLNLSSNPTDSLEGHNSSNIRPLENNLYQVPQSQRFAPTSTHRLSGSSDPVSTNTGNTSSLLGASLNTNMPMFGARQQDPKIFPTTADRSRISTGTMSFSAPSNNAFPTSTEFSAMSSRDSAFNTSIDSISLDKGGFGTGMHSLHSGFSSVVGELNHNRSDAGFQHKSMLNWMHPMGHSSMDSMSHSVNYGVQSSTSRESGQVNKPLGGHTAHHSMLGARQDAFSMSQAVGPQTLNLGMSDSMHVPMQMAHGSVGQARFLGHDDDTVDTSALDQMVTDILTE